MKSNLFFFVFSTTLINLTLSASSAFALQKNPQVKICRQLGGTFLAVNTATDQVGLCQFGKAIVSATDILTFENKESIGQSLNQYMKGTTQCEAGAEIRTGIIVGEGQSLQLCFYQDSSFIELGTLIKGMQSSDNELLNKVLGL